MHFATKCRQTQILVWLIWAIACLVFWTWPAQVSSGGSFPPELPALPGIITYEPRNGPLFPWQPRSRWRQWARQRYRAWQRAHRRARWLAHLARLALTGALSLAQLVDLATRSQLRRHLGALPVLYALLETLQVRQVINRYCPTRAEIDHGTVALVLVLNCLTMPLPLYQVADWLAKTVLVCTLGIPAIKFNDDRLARTLDAIQLHCRDIWQAIAHRALVQAQVDLSLIFYDLTAYTNCPLKRHILCAEGLPTEPNPASVGDLCPTSYMAFDKAIGITSPTATMLAAATSTSALPTTHPWTSASSRMDWMSRLTATFR